MSYVDGFVVPVPKKNVKKYLSIAKKAGRVWKDHGALDYCEAIADDVKPGKWTSFPQSVKLKSNETVIEATYLLEVTPWWQLQPDLQIVINPRADLPNDEGHPLDNSVTAGVRSKITF